MTSVDVNGKESVKNYIIEHEDFRNECLYTEEQREAVRQKALADDGIIEPLIAWEGKNYLVWGYEELAIAKEHNLHFEVKRIKFESVADCLAWLGEKCLATPSLTSFQKTEIGLKFWEYWQGKDEAKEESPLKKAALEKCGRTDRLAIIAIKAGISHNTVNKVCRILASENKKLIEDCRNDEISINAGYEAIIGGKTVEDEGGEDTDVSADKKKTQRMKKQKQKEVDSLAKYCLKGFASTHKKLDEHGLKFFVMRWNEEHPKNLIANKDVKKAINVLENKEK